MRINNNMMAMNTHRQFSINNDNVAKATEKLSSGYRINRAGDDAAGLAISEKMRAQIRGLNMASKNSQDAISLIQTAEGALTETHAILQRMRELGTQSASDTNQTIDRGALDQEFQALLDEIDDIASKTTFNEMSLLNGSFGSVAAVTPGSEIKVGSGGITSISLQGFSAGLAQTITFTGAGGGADYTATFDGVSISGISNVAGAQTINLDFGGGRIASITTSSAAAQDQFVAAGLDVLTFDVTGTAALIQTGANSGDTLSISIGDMSSDNVDGLAISGQDILSRTTANTALTAVNTAIGKVSTQRAALGAYQNRLQHKINNLDTSAENLQAAESRIRDLDMAKEMTNFTKNNILVQAATAMLAQANSAPQGVLQLLK